MAIEDGSAPLAPTAPPAPALSTKATASLVSGSISVFGLSIASANVIMQLSRLPVAYGVMESKVESGRVDRHPVKRLRTTLSYIVVALFGTAAEQETMRREVNRAHRHVRSAPTEPVPYNAFDRELQLWVAACLYWGLEDFRERMVGPFTPAEREAFYRHGARFGTTLQLRPDMWPADRAAFDDYWTASMDKVRMDATSRAYLRSLARLGFLPKPIGLLFGPFHEFITAGFLPPRFREEIGLPWNARRQAAFDRHVRLMARVNNALPAPLRQFPWNLYLRDVRRRIRTGRPIV
ncbi:oxygenase MpaB family protein [Actinomadura parmotrematis]|uniref:Oxygenase MpaB family protein n=1 Tax=Actinomadura parmotrematis TaxID=2864039 RepID=A0ABS7FWR6_9ACTN|nr:oxygenase MpaB family protein [Actinomadura parmotrematis]MBW8484425.1 oxygenase MpaB family protein [Actinomadura parmotrematis]